MKFKKNKRENVCKQLKRRLFSSSSSFHQVLLSLNLGCKLLQN